MEYILSYHIQHILHRQECSLLALEMRLVRLINRVQGLHLVKRTCARLTAHRGLHLVKMTHIL